MQIARRLNAGKDAFLHPESFHGTVGFTFPLPTEATLTIEKLVYGGDGLARLDGKVVLVPYVLPGEVVRVEIDRRKNDLFRGKVLELIAPSTSRVAPDCPYFQRCGGCQYQHIDYSIQVEQKRAILREVLQRVGKIEVADEIDVVAAEPWQYRNRIQLHIDRGQVGYFEHGSHKLCPIDHCPIASPALNNAIAKLNRQATATVELFTNETEVQVNVLDRVPRSLLSSLQSIGVTGPIEYAGFQVSRNSFFQVNRFLIDRLPEVALSGSEGDLALDLYAGVGLFAVSLAERFKQVIAVESSRSAFQRPRAQHHNHHGGEQNHRRLLGSLRRTPRLDSGRPASIRSGQACCQRIASHPGPANNHRLLRSCDAGARSARPVSRWLSHR